MMSSGKLTLCIDCGNTNIKFGVFDSVSLVANFRVATDTIKTSDEYAIMLRSLLKEDKLDPNQFEGAIISSVVPPVTPLMERAIEKVLAKNSIVVKPGIKTGMGIQAENPKELGSDLLCLAVGASVRHSLPAIIVSFGTATAFVAVSRKPDILGVAIAPGIISALNSLTMMTAKPPRIEIMVPETALGRNTIDSMRAGITFGFAGLVDRIAVEMSKNMDEQPTVIATGGLLNLISTVTTTVSRFDPFLSLYGLKALYDKNVEHRE